MYISRSSQNLINNFEFLIVFGPSKAQMLQKNNQQALCFVFKKDNTLFIIRKLLVCCLFCRQIEASSQTLRLLIIVLQHLTFVRPKHNRGSPFSQSRVSRAALRPFIKDVGIFRAIFDTPSPCRNLSTDLPNPYLLISCNIKI